MKSLYRIIRFTLLLSGIAYSISGCHAYKTTADPVAALYSDQEVITGIKTIQKIADDPRKALNWSVFTIHGSIDPLVPYTQALSLQDCLEKFNVKHYLFTVKGKKHGDFDAREMTSIYDQLWKFMDEIG